MGTVKKDYENSGCIVVFQAAKAGDYQVEELLRGKTTIMADASQSGKSSTLLHRRTGDGVSEKNPKRALNDNRINLY